MKNSHKRRLLQDIKQPKTEHKWTYIDETAYQTKVSMRICLEYKTTM